ncbi:hypothetical protein SELMODRAFT_403909 [Selaginella moellendorffii]|uniref:Retroviral polymerase SH3-like domain-containing protein n=1 Tax=Selaginella moellendorffii TaxID=88036 RepID=D8QSY5_SELML|nr:hypothetical protein SELMODRAFT_403909 [Selaginella moellendorffii]
MAAEDLKLKQSISKLSMDNAFIWFREVEFKLCSKDGGLLWDIVNADLNKPSPPPAEAAEGEIDSHKKELKVFKVHKARAKSLIMRWLDKGDKATIARTDSVAEAWDQLKKLYLEKSFVSKVGLQGKLNQAERMGHPIPTETLAEVALLGLGEEFDVVQSWKFTRDLPTFPEAEKAIREQESVLASRKANTMKRKKESGEPSAFFANKQFNTGTEELDILLKTFQHLIVASNAKLLLHTTEDEAVVDVDEAVEDVDEVNTMEQFETILKNLQQYQLQQQISLLLILNARITQGGSLVTLARRQGDLYFIPHQDTQEVQSLASEANCFLHIVDDYSRKVWAKSKDEVAAFHEKVEAELSVQLKMIRGINEKFNDYISDKGISHQSHAEQCVFLGYEDETKDGYRVWIPTRQNVFIRRTVKLDEKALPKIGTYQEPFEEGKEHSIENIQLVFSSDEDDDSDDENSENSVLPPGIEIPLGNQNAAVPVFPEPNQNDQVVLGNENELPRQEFQLRRSARRWKPNDRYLKQYEANTMTVTGEPNSLDETLQSSHADRWIAGMVDEFRSLLATQTFVLVPQPKHQKVSRPDIVSQYIQDPGLRHCDNMIADMFTKPLEK